MKSLFLIVALLIAFSSLASEFEWDVGSKRLADIDCDGTPDELLIGYTKTVFQLKVISSSTKGPSTLNFGLGQPGKQAALCGTTVSIRLYETDIDSIREEFGEVFEAIGHSLVASI